MSRERNYSTSDERWDDRVHAIARDGYTLADLKLRASLSAWDRRRMEQAIIDIQEGNEAPKRTTSPRDGYLSQEQAEELYRRYKSYRKAARESGYSSTHIRRMHLGLD